MPLLERDEAIAGLAAALADATQHRGRVVLLGAEAGMGKTTLVRAFVDRAGVRVWEGACDDLLTPRTLGPFHDLARVAGPGIAAALDLAGRGGPADAVERVVAALLDALHTGPPTVVVIEDLHWADEASLDVLAVLARRVTRAPVLLLLTYRDDEVTPAAPLQRFLGGVRPPIGVRLGLAPLSLQAVIALAEDHGAALRVHGATAGNPFLVTEALAARDEGIPAVVTDAVLARIAPLPERTRALLDQVAVVPTAAETTLLDDIVPDWLDAAGPAEERRILRLAGEGLGFRHELARLAVLDALPDARRRALDAAVLAGLLRRDRPDLARVLHHAVRAGDVEAILAHGPAAARDAAAAGAPGRRWPTSPMSYRTPTGFPSWSARNCMRHTPGSCTTRTASRKPSRPPDGRCPCAWRKARRAHWRRHSSRSRVCST